jgi:4-amino-4-deoxy-L-arabinose transferase-like glycosyltransferase
MTSARHVRSTTARLPPSSSQWSASLGLIAVLCLFCAPLFVGLGDRDLGVDEAIYSYAVDRIIETGDWLTPRAIPNDRPFLEKPPLKFWMVAGAIRVGLLPHDEFGLRFMDALFGAVAFVYVFWLGRWLAGSVCGFVAVLVLFTVDALLFEHGLRSNNMEAALVLSYCGGVYHFARWVEDSSTRRPSLHALAVAGYFTLGFMTKFVAVLFLPLVCAVALAWRGDALPRIRSSWRDWVVPVLLVFAASTPWFVYQTLQTGSGLWQIIFGQHVYTRFTNALDPAHLQPWHYYYSQMWTVFTRSGSHWIAAIGILVLAVKGWTGRPWLAGLLFVWWMVPFALMSIGTSKLFHYAYSFLPPIALGVGAVADVLCRAIASRAAAIAGAAERGLSRVIGRTWARKWPAVAGRFRSLTWTTNEHPSRARSFARQLLVAAAVFALALGVWTSVSGRIQWDVNGVELLRNSSVTRPIFIAAVLLCLAGYARILISAVPIMAVAAMLMAGVGWPRNPISAYPLTIGRLTSVSHSWRALRDCAVTLPSAPAGTHVYPSYQLLNHWPYYYLRHVGPWVEHDGSPKADELELRLYTFGQQSLVILSRGDYQTFIRQTALGEVQAVGVPLGLEVSEDIVLLTPGPFEVCATAAIAAGGQGIRDLPVGGTRP